MRRHDQATVDHVTETGHAAMYYSAGRLYRTAYCTDCSWFAWRA